MLLCPERFHCNYSVLYRYVCILISRSADNHNISILNFDQCQFKSCTTVTIIDDLIDEPVESFNATLDRSPGLDVRITLSPVIIQFQTATPFRSEPIDGIKVFSYDLYNRVLGRG